MEGPHVRNVMVDRAKGITYEVMAYRQLTREEVIYQVRIYKSQPKRRGKVPDRGGTVTILTSLGR